VLTLGKIFSFIPYLTVFHLWRFSESNGPIGKKSSARENVPGKKELNQRELAKILSAANRLQRDAVYLG
jgi:hypothetical protein